MISFRRKPLRIAAVILILGAVLSSCIPAQVETSAPEAPSTATSSPTEAILETTPAPTATTEPIATALPSPTVTPTLSEEEALAYFQELFKDNGGCELPCWWGITPGVTTEEEMVSTLSILDTPDVSYYKNGLNEEVYEYRYEITGSAKEAYPESNTYSARIWIIDGKVAFIVTGADNVSEDFDYTFAGLFSGLDTPSEIRIQPLVDSWQPYYYIEIFNYERGIGISYSDAFEVNGEDLSICFIDAPNGYRYFPPGLVLFSPEEQYTFEELTQRTLFYKTVLYETQGDYRLDDIAFGYSVADFYYQFGLLQSDQCIQMDESVFVLLGEEELWE